MAVLTANCNRTFAVSKEKSNEFLNYKCGSALRNQNEKTLSKISKSVVTDKTTK